MSWLIRGWRRILMGLMPLGLVLVSCSQGVGVPDLTGMAATQGNPAAVAGPDESRATSPDDSGYLTINVEMTDIGVQPASIYIPAGQRVLLVMRNRGNYKHHFHISGLVPQDMLWLSKETGDNETDGMDASEHSEHNHSGQMVSYHKCSPGSVICPTGNSVHAHAESGDLDAIFFTATNTGTFLAEDPLHPEIIAKVTVF